MEASFLTQLPPLDISIFLTVTAAPLVIGLKVKEVAETKFGNLLPEDPVIRQLTCGAVVLTVDVIMSAAVATIFSIPILTALTVNFFAASAYGIYSLDWHILRGQMNLENNEIRERLNELETLERRFTDTNALIEEHAGRLGELEREDHINEGLAGLEGRVNEVERNMIRGSDFREYFNGAAQEITDAIQKLNENALNGDHVARSVSQLVGMLDDLRTQLDVVSVLSERVDELEERLGT